MHPFLATFHQLPFARRLGALARRAVFTWTLLGLLILVAWLTRTHLESLSAAWLLRLGFGSADLWALDLERIFTSAISTHGGPVFWRALVAVAVIVGIAEYRTGTRRTAIVFVGSHVLSLIALALLVDTPVSFWHASLAELLYSTRDVGPSAGYFGCLALVCSTLSGGPRRYVQAGILVALIAVLAFTWTRPNLAPVEILAATAHAIAFPLGWVLTLGTRRWTSGSPLRRGEVRAPDAFHRANTDRERTTTSPS